MPPMEAIALTKQMAMLNKEVAKMAMKQKMAKYLGEKITIYLGEASTHPIRLFFDFFRTGVDKS